MSLNYYSTVLWMGPLGIEARMKGWLGLLFHCMKAKWYLAGWFQYKTGFNMNPCPLILCLLIDNRDVYYSGQWSLTLLCVFLSGIWYHWDEPWGCSSPIWCQLSIAGWFVLIGLLSIELWLFSYLWYRRVFRIIPYGILLAVGALKCCCSKHEALLFSR